MPQTFSMSMNVRELKPNYGQIVPFKGSDEDYWWRENKLADMSDIYSSYLNAEQRFCLILTTVNRLWRLYYSNKGIYTWVVKVYTQGILRSKSTYTGIRRELQFPLFHQFLYSKIKACIPTLFLASFSILQETAYLIRRSSIFFIRHNNPICLSFESYKNIKNLSKQEV